MFPIELIACKESELHHQILPLLVGNVFHITTAVGLDGIINDQAIRNNRTGSLPFTFGQSDNSYGRRHGFVCLFDLRNLSDTLIDDALLRYYFLNPTFAACNPIFLIMSQNIFAHLISWKRAEAEQAYKEVWIPNVEVWYDGDISLDEISRGVDVRITPTPSAHREMLEAIWSKKRSKS